MLDIYDKLDATAIAALVRSGEVSAQEVMDSALARIETLWSHARKVTGATDDWLFGAYSLADVFYTPVAARIIGYDLPVSPSARRYCEALLSTPHVQDWRRAAETVTYDPEPYPQTLSGDPWPIG